MAARRYYKKTSKKVGYTDAEKAEYYKKKYLEAQRSGSEPKIRKYASKINESSGRPYSYNPQLAAAASPKEANQNVKLSPCATEYMNCLLNPCGAEPSCIPSMGACNSSKMKVSARGSFATSIQTAGPNAANDGFGFISFRPGNMIISNPATLAAGQEPILFSTSNYSVSPSISRVSLITSNGIASVTGLGTNVSNSPYLDTDLAPYRPTGVTGSGPPAGGLHYRLVSACLRIRYTGTTLNCAGSIYSLTEPEHQPLGTPTLGGVSIAALGQYPSTNNTSVEDAQHDWVELINGGPMSPNEMEYVTGFGNGAPNASYMVFLIAVPPGISLTFDYEAWCNFEVIGPQIRQKTMSFADPVGLNVINNGVQSAMSAGGQQSHHGHRTFLSKALSFIGHAAKKSLTYVFGGGATSGEPSIKGFAKDVLPGLLVRAAPLLM